MLFVILIVFAIIGWAVQARLKSKFKQFSKIPIQGQLSGAEVADKMLKEHGIYDVEIISTPGKLTDHYNPAKKTINLSESVYKGRTVAAAAVAAHETGHAVQHAEAYSFLQLRSQMVPIVSISSQLLNWILMIGLFVGFTGILSFEPLLYVVIIAQGAITLFSLVTLPVEFDASNRALVWLDRSGLTSHIEQDKAKSALHWAAMTYVVSALAAVTTLLYYVWMLVGRD